MIDNLPALVYPLLPQNTCEWIIGISGGVDSVVLFDLCQKYAASTKQEIKIIPVHLNHLTRGKDSTQDEELCRRLCADAGYQLRSRRLDIPGIATASKRNFEEIAREERHKLFAEIAREANLTKPALLLAHHHDDNQETILMRLLRGSGLRGLGGIRYTTPLPRYSTDTDSDIQIYRPLYSCRRKDITDYAIKHKLSWREDQSNADTDYTRNLIRHIILPALKLIDNTCDRKLDKLPELTAKAEDCLQREIDSIQCSTLRFQTYIKEDSARKANNTAFCRVVENIGNRLCPGFLLTANAYHALKELHRNNISATDLAGDLHISLYSGKFYIYRKNQPSYQINYQNKPDLFHYEDTNFSLSIHKTRIAGDIPHQDDPNTEYIPLEFSDKTLTLQNPEPQQRVTPLGLNTKMRLLKLLKNKGIPKYLRSQIPVLYCEKEPIWIPGVALCAQARIKHPATEVFCLRYSEKTL